MKELILLSSFIGVKPISYRIRIHDHGLKMND